MQNPTQTMHVYDMPLRVIAGLSTLAKSQEEDENTSTGVVVSEVGEPQVVNHPAWIDPFVAYQLRAPRENLTPDFIFGRATVGNAFSAFLPRRFSAPAVGTRLVIDPVCTFPQYVMLQLYNFYHADFFYIVHVPAPLGTGIYLKVYAPELDSTTVTRGIRFKPSASPTMAFSVPWSNDLSSVPTTSGRLGQSGGSIVIETIEDNSNETVNTPLSITVWCCMANVDMTGYAIADATAYNYPGMNFIPTPVPTEAIAPANPDDKTPIPIYGEEQADNEVTAEGGKLVQELIYDHSAIPVAPQVEKEAEQPEAPASTVATRKNDTGHLATKWYDFVKISLSNPKDMSWTTLTIDPYNNVTLSRNGEAMVLPWRRNVWTTGSKAIGYIRTMAAQINIPRPPQISGVLEVKDSINNSSISLVEFGGKVEIPLLPKVFNGLANSTKLPRHWLNPWMRTAESKIELQYRIIAFNRTSDIADLSVSVLLRPGDSTFQMTTKPDNSVDTRHFELVDRLMYEFENLRIHGEEQGLPEETPEREVNPAQFITPAVGFTAEKYNLHEELGECEDLELDEFPVLVFKGEVPVGEVTPIQLDLATIYDFAWDGEQNAISQKFQRFAHLIPKSAGGFGPVIGNYTITANLPTGVAGRILHNCIPGDCVDLSVSRIFGLKSLFGLMGTAVTSIGGPLLSGVVNTAAPILSGAAHAIGGNVVGGLTDTVLGAASNLLTHKEKEQPSANAEAMAGDIPISRFVEMLKYVKGNYESNPVFPTLLVEPQNFVSNALAALTKIPIEVFANMRNIKVERNLFDRTVTPIVEEEAIADIVIPNHAYAFILRDFLQCKRAFKPGTKQQVYFKQFLTVLSQRNTRTHITLKDITSCSIDEESVATKIERVKHYLDSNLGGETTEEFSRTDTGLPLNAIRKLVLSESKRRTERYVAETVFPSVRQ
ncbi:VP4 [Drosophila immigrans Nora virus]|uniref:VP4 n=1 Tax=Drosophila immigrans Nora virus TaxID=1500866 RepID=UPI0004D1CAEA|nr:VP4 [Drosophila immigrans Nora virus]AHZ92155.1 VP4 [Drosophila immigrans Nora virus]